MSSQDVVFVAVGEVDDKLIEPVLRRCLYTLRDYSFKKNIPVRLSFCSLLNKDDRPLDFHELDAFAYRTGVSYFSTSGKVGLYDFIDERYGGPLPLIVYLGGGKSGVTETAVCVSAKGNEYRNLPRKIERALNRPSPKKQKFLLWTEVACLALFAIICGIITIKIKNKKTELLTVVEQKDEIDYVRVYTGDGDRLILRVNGEEDAPEIMRIREDEVLARIADRGAWTEVEYHGLHGYVHSQWLSTTYEKNGKTHKITDHNYEIKDIVSQYAFGKAALEQGYSAIGMSYIKKAAESNLIAAKWELYRQNDEVSILKEIDKESNPYENTVITYYTKRADVEEKVNNDAKLADKFRRMAREQRENLEAIKRQAAKKLSEYYFDKDIKKAAEYYELAIERGLKGDDEYMYSLAKKFDPNLNSAESQKWYRKTSYYIDSYDYYFDGWW